MVGTHRTVDVITSLDAALTAPCFARVNDEVDDIVEVDCGAVEDQVIVSLCQPGRPGSGAHGVGAPRMGEAPGRRAID
jgi:hypothetical protein